MGKLIKEVVSNDILKLGGVHKGYKHERMNYSDNELERIFHSEWKKENKQIPFVNFGWGTLQDLFATPPKHWTQKHGGFKVLINARDQYIVATVIQWLGTNCGFCFLSNVLRKAGYKIEKIK